MFCHVSLEFINLIGRANNFTQRYALGVIGSWRLLSYCVWLVCRPLNNIPAPWKNKVRQNKREVNKYTVSKTSKRKNSSSSNQEGRAGNTLSYEFEESWCQDIPSVNYLALLKVNKSMKIHSSEIVSSVSWEGSEYFCSSDHLMVPTPTGFYVWSSHDIQKSW